MNAHPKGYVPVSEAAERAGVPLRTLQRWCEDGDVKGARRQPWGGRRGFRWLVPVRWLEGRAA